MTREEAILYLTPIAESASLERYKEALSMAVAALREQEEREKGCEYCNEDCDGYRKMIGAFSITNPLHGNVWNIETCHCKPRQIYFCPMCGRMLTEPPKENDHET